VIPVSFKEFPALGILGLSFDYPNPLVVEAYRKYHQQFLIEARPDDRAKLVEVYLG
jgi:hypothetical protein